MATQVYLVISILALLLLVAALFLSRRGRQGSRMSRLTAVALVLIIAANLFENELIAYALIGAGVALAVIDIVRRRNQGPGES